jgi:hypothetical protein
MVFTAAQRRLYCLYWRHFFMLSHLNLSTRQLPFHSFFPCLFIAAFPEHIVTTASSGIKSAGFLKFHFSKNHLPCLKICLKHYSDENDFFRNVHQCSQHHDPILDPSRLPKSERFAGFKNPRCGRPLVEPDLCPAASSAGPYLVRAIFGRCARTQLSVNGS